MTGLSARQHVEDELRRELFGPTRVDGPRGEPLDTHGSLAFDSWEAYDKVWHDSVSFEEILRDVDPLRRYGIGVLFASGRTSEGESTLSTVGLPTDDIERDTIEPPEIAVRASDAGSPDADDFDLKDANAFHPSAMGFSARLRVEPNQSFKVAASYARYEQLNVRVVESQRTLWARRPVELVATVSHDNLGGFRSVTTLPTQVLVGADDSPAQIRIYSRSLTEDAAQGTQLVTFVLQNNSQRNGAAGAMFQSQLGITLLDGARVESYIEAPPPDTADLEEQSIDLLFRSKQTFAVGHGCAATWGEVTDESVLEVRADPLPSFELPSLTADIEIDGVPLHVSMNELAEGTAVGDDQLRRAIDAYAKWIVQRRLEAEGLPSRYTLAAQRHVELCEEALQRIEEGFSLLTHSPLARRSFRLANEAMLHQQVRSGAKRRPVSIARDRTLRIDGEQPRVDAEDLAQKRWRPFQIAFVLASLPEIIDPRHRRRELVDLIFFPTGGGKTEAYLGTAALAMFARRLRDPNDNGTEVLMRYTLRLLTAQQFLRAAALICVMEDIRSRESDLGSGTFSIGIWLGGTTTPNRWEDARNRHLRLGKDPRAENPFLLLGCPWCGTQFGPVQAGRGAVQVVGYVRVGPRVLFICPDLSCRFSKGEGLPIHVVDEAIYDSRPSMVIGTVDKFAMLAWKPEARAMFGLDLAGKRTASPPGLIIQDELHLISGPLGSMVGLYEPVVEDLCTDHRAGASIRPKILASTATIRSYERQVRDLYGRAEVRLFPPHGLEDGSSFFAETARDANGIAVPGRRYVGVMSPSLGSIQTVQVRVAAATLQAPMSIPEEDRDGYWTNLNFLNSLRELGNTVSLIQSDIPDYLTGIRRRDALGTDSIRWPRQTMELTSRRKSDEITRAIEELQTPLGEDGCVDICLASNIIEVGVDIDRLSLMTVIGQPKTTAQYIQVSGRVGRRWWDRPGLVITIYGAAKPRDRSHYERFRSYHERLYAAVEPTSLTPFALPVLLRGLHGSVVSYIRQNSAASLGPDPFPQESFEEARELLRGRASKVDSEELGAFDAVVEQRSREWRLGERTTWSANSWGGDPQQGLMRYAGSSASAEAKHAITWDVPSSMRSVDAECELRVTSAYVRDDIAEVPVDE